VINKEPVNITLKSKHIKITKANTVSPGKDQVNFQELQNHLFGVKMESLQKFPSKVLLEIAGSFHLLLPLPVSQVEFTTYSPIAHMLPMVLSRCTSTSEVKESVLPLMIESQFLILVLDIPLHIHQSTTNHLQLELGG